MAGRATSVESICYPVRNNPFLNIPLLRSLVLYPARCSINRPQRCCLKKTLWWFILQIGCSSSAKKAAYAWTFLFQIINHAFSRKYAFLFFKKHFKTRRRRIWKKNYFFNGFIFLLIIKRIAVWTCWVCLDFDQLAQHLDIRENIQNGWSLDYPKNEIFSLQANENG